MPNTLYETRFRIHRIRCWATVGHVRVYDHQTCKISRSLESSPPVYAPCVLRTVTRNRIKTPGLSLKRSTRKHRPGLHICPNVNITKRAHWCNRSRQTLVSQKVNIKTRDRNLPVQQRVESPHSVAQVVRENDLAFGTQIHMESGSVSSCNNHPPKCLLNFGPNSTCTQSGGNNVRPPFLMFCSICNVSASINDRPAHVTSRKMCPSTPALGDLRHIKV